MLSYFGEVRTHWRALAAALAGISMGLSLNNYTAGLFGPYLVDAFGWSKSKYALVGTFALILVLVLPLAGRMSDRFGMRKVILLGIVGMPVTFLAMSMMSGSFYEFYILNLVQTALGAFTTSSIYSRLIADRLDKARGFGFAVIMSGPPLAGALTNPLLRS